MKSLPRGRLLPAIGIPGRDVVGVEFARPSIPPAVRFARFASRLAEDGPPTALRAVVLLPPNADAVPRGLMVSSGLPAMPNWPVHVGVPMGMDLANSPAMRSS